MKPRVNYYGELVATTKMVHRMTGDVCDVVLRWGLAKDPAPWPNVYPACPDLKPGKVHLYYEQQGWHFPEREEIVSGSAILRWKSDTHWSR